MSEYRQGNKNGTPSEESVPLDHSVNGILLEVTLQQAFQTAAVAGLVASHLVDGVVGCAASQHWGAIFQVPIRQV